MAPRMKASLGPAKIAVQKVRRWKLYFCYCRFQPDRLNLLWTLDERICVHFQARGARETIVQPEERVGVHRQDCLAIPAARSAAQVARISCFVKD